MKKLPLRKSRIAKLALLFSVFASTAFSQNWTGAVDADWNNSANWSAWPLNDSTIIIDTANYTGNEVSPILDSASVFTPKIMIVQNGAQLMIKDTLNVDSIVEVIGAGTSLTVQTDTFDVFNVGIGNNGRLTATGGSQVNILLGIVNVDEWIISESQSLIMINGGVVNTGNMVANVGGKLTLTGGDVTVVDTLKLADGDTTSSSVFNMYGGDLTVDGEFVLENKAGNYAPMFDSYSGFATINGNVTWDGTAPGAGTPVFRTGGVSIVNINGNVSRVDTSTVNMYWYIRHGSHVNFNGSLIETVSATDSIWVSDGSIFNIAGNTTFNNVGVFYSNSGGITNLSDTITINNAGVFYSDQGASFKIIGSTTLAEDTGTYQFQNINIVTSGVLNHFTSAPINVFGSWNNAGEFNTDSNTVILNGPFPQVVGGALEQTSFHNLIVNNGSTNGIVLLGEADIEGTLTLADGKLNTNTGASLIVRDNATANGSSAASFVNGPMTKEGDDAFVFPIGKNAKWRRLAISAPSASGSFKAEYFDSPYGNLTPDSPLTAISTAEYWMLDTLSSANTVQVTLYWEDALASSIINCADIAVAGFNDATSLWEKIASTASGSCTGSGAGSIQTNTALSPNLYYTIGFTNVVTTQNITICLGDSIEVGNNVYFATGTYTDILVDINNLDSIVITHLTVIDPVTILQTIDLCAGEVLVVGSNTYTVSGSYTDTLVSMLGCDSIVLSNLTIALPINDTVIQTGLVLTAVNAAATYQWIDCNTSLPIAGGTTQSFTFDVSGSYAVILTEVTCVDTSACFQVIIDGIDEAAAANQITVFPNPVSQNGTMQIANLQGGEKVEIISVQGKLLAEMLNKKDQQVVSFSNLNLAAGIYFVKVTNNTSTSTVKLLVE